MFFLILGLLGILIIAAKNLGTPVPYALISVSDSTFEIVLPNTNIIIRSSLTDREQVVYDLTVDKAEISRKDIEEKLGGSQTMSGRILRQLALKGTIQSVGGKNNSRKSIID